MAKFADESARKTASMCLRRVLAYAQSLEVAITACLFPNGDPVGFARHSESATIAYRAVSSPLRDLAVCLHQLDGWCGIDVGEIASLGVAHVTEVKERLFHVGFGGRSIPYSPTDASRPAAKLAFAPDGPDALPPVEGETLSTLRDAIRKIERSTLLTEESKPVLGVGLAERLEYTLTRAVLQVGLLQSVGECGDDDVEAPDWRETLLRRQMARVWAVVTHHNELAFAVDAIDFPLAKGRYNVLPEKVSQECTTDSGFWLPPVVATWHNPGDTWHHAVVASSRALACDALTKVAPQLSEHPECCWSEWLRAGDVDWDEQFWRVAMLISQQHEADLGVTFSHLLQCGYYHLLRGDDRLLAVGESRLIYLLCEEVLAATSTLKGASLALVESAVHAFAAPWARLETTYGERLLPEDERVGVIDIGAESAVDPCPFDFAGTETPAPIATGETNYTLRCVWLGENIFRIGDQDPFTVPAVRAQVIADCIEHFSGKPFETADMIRVGLVESDTRHLRNAANKDSMLFGYVRAPKVKNKGGYYITIEDGRSPQAATTP